ncbi:MAG: carbohydrate binding family 9 domain-containing protein [Candidatus Kapaibacterium sp.]
MSIAYNCKQLLVRCMVSIFCCTSISALAGEVATDGSKHFMPNRKPVVSVPRFPEKSISIDGKIDEPIWKKAATAGNFCEIRPGDNTCPPVGTEAYMGYDDKYLYFAFIAYDNPADIRVSLQDRDRIFRDDFIGIILDTYQSSAWAYELFVNPIGIQGDLRWMNNGNEDESLDVIFESKGIVTDSGYQVEMAIPFSSLRFPDKDIQSWDFTILRIQPRQTRRQISWTENSRDNSCWPCQFGTMTGITNIRAGSAVQILPSIVGSQSGALTNPSDPESGFTHSPVKGDFGLSLRYPFSSNLSVEAAYNPDFSQVESDQALIDANSTFRLFYPERRPFFSEGADLYQTWINAVYSRSINSPLAAMKLTGGIGNTSFGMLSAYDRQTQVIVPLEERSLFGITGKSLTNILRIRHSYNDGSNIGGLFTDRQYDGGGYSLTGGLDGMYRFWDNMQLEGQLLVSSTKEAFQPDVCASSSTFDHGNYTATLDGEKFGGYAFYTGLRHYGRNFMFELQGAQMSPGFRAETGFEPRANQQKITYWSGYKLYPNGAVVEDWQPGLSFGRIWNFDGTVKDGWIVPSINVRFKGQTYLSFDYLMSEERYNNFYFVGIRRLSGNFGSQFSEYFQGDSYITTGTSIARNVDGHVLGTILSAGGSITLKPLDRLTIQENIDYARLDYPSGENIYDGIVVRTRINYQHSRELSARVVVQYDSFSSSLSFEPLISYKLNPFSIFYIGSTSRWQNFHDTQKPNSQDYFDSTYRPASRGYFFKVQYLFAV